MIETIYLKISNFLLSPVFADSLSGRLVGGLDEATSYTCSPDVEGAACLAGYVSVILDFAIPLATLAAVGIMSFAAYTMITSQGNPEKINEAREAITNAIVGFALIALSIAILMLIQNTLRIPLPTN